MSYCVQVSLLFTSIPTGTERESEPTHLHNALSLLCLSGKQLHLAQRSMLRLVWGSLAEPELQPVEWTDGPILD